MLFRATLPFLASIAAVVATGPGVVLDGCFGLAGSASRDATCPGYGDTCGIPGVAESWSQNLTYLPVRDIRVAVFVMAADDGSSACASESVVDAQLSVLNNYFAGAKATFRASYSTVNSSFYLSRRVLPFCDFSLVGNGECDSFCNASITNYDGGDCVPVSPYINEECSGGTGAMCVEACNIAAYNWSSGACCDVSIVSNPERHCRDPTSPLRAYVSFDEIKLASTEGGTPPLSSWNIYVAPYTECQWCGASSVLPWDFNGSDTLAQGTAYNNFTLPNFGYLVGPHEAGHTFGLLHPFVYSESGTMPCGYECFEGEQYPAGASGSEVLGDLIADTRPTVLNMLCEDPPEVDCAGQPWVDTPYRNIMGFGYVQEGCVNVSTAFTPHQNGRMRCYLETTYSKWWQ
jgi:hypothetical protein